MKGVILKCLQELVEKQFGKEQWQAICRGAGVSEHALFLVSTDVEDKQALGLLQATCEVLGLSLEQAADAFGEYWVNNFAPKIYATYYRDCHSAAQFLLKMDEVHRLSTERLDNAHPPRFDYRWEDERTLIMVYRSQRNLVDLVLGLARGVGKRFGEKLEVSKLGDTEVKIVFPQPARP